MSMVTTNIVLVCAVYKSIDRMTSLVTNLRNVEMIEDIKCIFVNTGEVVPYFLRAIQDLPDARLMQVEAKRRAYDAIMREKIYAVTGYCNSGTILVSTDDDYIFGKHSFPLLLRLFSQNPQIDYLSLTRTALPDYPFPEVTLSGFNFLKVPSIMGGSIVANAWQFFDHLEEYWDGNVSDPMFDRGFFEFLVKKTEDKTPCYMPRDFSIGQHINFISNYIEMKNGPDDFMSGINFIESRNILEGE